LRNAQDHAFALLAHQRGLIAREQIERVEAGRPAARTFAEAAVRHGALAPDAAAGVARELVGARFGCGRCGRSLGWGELERLPAFACERCGGPLTRAARGSESGRGSTSSRAARGSSFGRATGPPAAGGSPSSSGGVGRTVGGYALLSELGRGSNGVVYLARRPDLGRLFALKELRDPHLADEETLARFRLEAAVASKIADPGVVAVQDVGVDGRSHFLVMDYCPGPTLKARLREGPLPVAEAAELVATLAETAQAAHDAGVIHRDLKPSNVILDEKAGRPRITDFGTARDRTLLATLTKTGDVMGTPFYMPPEQLRGENRQLDHRADVYALGVILYECLTGSLPFQAPTPLALVNEVCREDPRPARELRPDVPVELEGVCLRAMARDRDDRPASARELARALRRASPGGAGRRAARRRSAPAASAGWVKATAGALVGGALVGVVVLAVGDRGGETPAPRAGEPPPVSPDDDDRAERVAALLARADEALARWARPSGEDGPPAAAAEALDEAVALAGDDGDVAAAARLRRATYRLRRGELVAARTDADAVIQADRAGSGPGLDAALVAARAAEELGQLAEAERRYRLVADGAAGGRRQAARAALARIAGDPAASSARAGEGWQGERGLAALALELARAGLELGEELDDVEAALEALDTLAPDDPLVHAAWALLRLQQGEGQAAGERSARAARLAGPTPPLLVRIAAGAAAVRGASPGRAVELLEAAANAPGGEGDAARLVHLAVAARLGGDAARAVATWREAEEVDPDRAERIAGLYYDARQRAALAEPPPSRPDPRPEAATPFGGPPGGVVGPEDLFELFGRAGAAGPESPLARRLAAIEVRRGERLEPGQAAALEERVAGIEGFVRDDVLEALEAAARGEEWDAVEPHVERAVRYGDGDRLALEALAWLLVAQGRPAAEDLLERAAALAPGERPRLARLRGQLRWRQGRRGEADAVLREVESADPGGFEGRCAAALRRLIRLDIEAARAEAEAALAARPDAAEAHLLAAVALQGAGEGEAAVDHLERAHARIGFIDARLDAIVAVEGARGSELTEAMRGLGAMFFGRWQSEQGPADFTRVIAAELLLAGDAGSSRARRRAGALLDGAAGDRADVAWTRGRLALVAGEGRAAVLASWRRALELQPGHPVPPADARRFEAAFEEDLTRALAGGG